MTLRHSTVLCAGLASIIAVLGCAAEQQRPMPMDTSAANGLVAMPLYDETAYYNAVKNRWSGLGDYAGLFNAQYMTRMARIALMPPKAMRCRPSETL